MYAAASAFLFFCPSPELRRRGAGLTGTWFNGYLVLQGSTHFRTARYKAVLESLARERLGTRWSRYPFSRWRPQTGGWRDAVKYSIVHYSIVEYSTS